MICDATKPAMRLQARGDEWMSRGAYEGATISGGEQRQSDLFQVEIAPRFTTEQWAEAPGFPGYSVSSGGRFRNERTGRMLAGSPNHNGYTHIGMSRNGKQDFMLAHRIVATAFIPKPATNQYLVVNHINGNRGDNRADNLEWATIQHNNTEWRRRSRNQ